MSNSKTAIVVGAVVPGIGRAVTDRFLQDGYKVHGLYSQHHTSEAEASSNIANLSLTQVDYRVLDDLRSSIESVSSVDALVVADFLFEMENPEKLDDDLWAALIDVNLLMPHRVHQAVRPKLSSSAAVVFVTSTEGFIGSFGASAYAASKAAVHNLVKSLANTAPAGVRVNAVAAGWIGGVMDTDEVFDMSRRITPLGRLGAPEEIASVAAFLCGQDASFVNGAVIVADGGYSGVDTISKFEFEASQSDA